jgi:hypothetical protein
MDNRNEDTQAAKNERRIDNLRNLVERQTRTERHLEEHSDISKSAENIAHVKELQREREGEIQNLKNIIAHGEQYNNQYLDNTKKNFVYTEGYLNHNADHMDKDSFEDAKKKQEHRKEQIDILK